ncbi:diguanylate cyclase domain-containing protein [Salinisphaera hydrothermalis]|uniref:Diguanylate cyclase (GGDEF) domain-containing protein n=1 Tax=Salinisphaera hydrothermalis (strain C41B8) TaxID=1304275 RepID=A0A084IQ70_SALHC|nr:diguanylate cyclase [Salinisphaera hydrothermalis]KEZ78854.1 diguanylate cyclase (GGDEF) domain-containing protein [Salinisphaera hydrothermalis C41B8]
MSDSSNDDPAPSKVLVVDDLYANRVALRRVLQRIDVDVVEAGSGNDALAACLDHEFALILLDVQMPDMDGMEVAELLNGEESTRDTAIIFVTAGSSDDMDRLKGYRLGAVDYITKPIDERLLQAKVCNFVELYDSRRALRRARDELDAVNNQLRGEIEIRRSAEARAQHLATHDALTGLPNRLLFVDRLSSMTKRARRRAGRFAIGYMDLDGFKPVNDAYGHRAGDVVLEHVARRLEQTLQDVDTAARFGGDEFALLIEDIDSEQACLSRCQDVLEAVSAPIAVPTSTGHIEVEISASLGIAFYPEHGNDVDELMHNADSALYRVKYEGKASVRLFQSHDDARPMPIGGQNHRLIQ